jgi:hypothetical protein
MSTSAAARIAADTYAGRWTRRGIPAGHRADSFTAAALAAHFADMDEIAVWESAGYTRGGYELFCRSRYVAQSDGSLAGYSAEGQRVIIHPADRRIRILTR